MTLLASLLHVLLALALSPLLTGVIRRVKAWFAGRRGPSYFQAYYDLAKLFRKGAVYSRTTTWVFRAGPVAGLAAVLLVLGIVPLGTVRGLMGFPGDLILLIYVLGLLRFLTVLAALDTGSSFEGMGASREMQFSLLTEPALLLGLAAAAICTRRLGLSDMYSQWFAAPPSTVAPMAVLLAGAFLIVLLAENARIPVDDPTTHLELTMIHEVMVLNHSGVDLGFIEYASSLKLWIFSTLLVGVAVPPFFAHPLLNLATGIVGVFFVGAVVGGIESTMARLRLLRVPQLLVVASILSVLAVFWALR